MSAKHTPGPWHVFSVYAQHEVRTPTDALVAVANDRANARLIAAAPDLLEALRVFVSAAYPVTTEINPRGHAWSEAYLDQALDNARAAIAKAEGA